MNIFVSGGSGAIGRTAVPRLRDAGHAVSAPSSVDLDLLDAGIDLRGRIAGHDAVLHLATRLPKPGEQWTPSGWRANEALRRDGTKALVDAALDTGVTRCILPSVTWVEPEDGSAPDPSLRSVLQAESEVARFAASGHRGVVLRFGLLHGPGTGLDAPDLRFGAALHIDDAVTALLGALDADSGIYVLSDDEQDPPARPFANHSISASPASRN